MIDAGPQSASDVSDEGQTRISSDISDHLGEGARLCEANFGILALYDDRKFRVAAMHNVPPRVCRVPAERTGD